MIEYSTYTLSNGLRVIVLPSASPVVYCGYGIAAGSRHEEPGCEGLAHFCEHMSFKGTRRRRACHVINALERVGGDLNAFTNKEDTFFYAAVLNEHLPRAVDLLTDMVFCSTYPQHEIDREVEIICDEIESYNDSPAELIYDEFENLLFAGHPIGHNILGQADRVRRFTTADALRFAHDYYQPSRAIFFAYGDVRPARVAALLCRAMGCTTQADATLPSTDEMGQKQPFTADTEGRTVVSVRPTHQAHVMTGCPTFGTHDPRRIPLFVLNNILGGPGMSARLNMSLRERHGLVYTVESSMVCYGDTGLWATYFGCDPHDVQHCLRLVRSEIDRLCQHALSPTQLSRAKRQLRGQLGIACDNRENFALDFGKSYLHYGWEKDIDRLYAQIDAVTAADLQQVAQQLLNPHRLTTLIYTPKP